MGVDGGSGRPRQGGGLTLRIARVVPDLPTYAVDEGFRYATDDPVSVGSLVRVPLGRRVVRGWVVGLEDGEPDGLKPIKAVSSETAFFTPALLQTLRWASLHYIAPLATLLRRSGPPNLPQPIVEPPQEPIRRASEGQCPAPVATAMKGARSPSVYTMTDEQGVTSLLGHVGQVAAAGGSAMVILATGSEVAGHAESLRTSLGSRLLEVQPSAADREVTSAWSTACAVPGHVVVGTHRIAFWPVANLRLAVVVEEGRRAMRDRQTPTVHAREVIRRRASVERFNVWYLGSVPSTTVLAAGVRIERRTARSWPPVEIVDRSEAPPGGGLLTDRVRAAVRGAMKRGMRIFVFSHRRGYAPALRCVACKTLRVCPSCGSRPEPGEECNRCGAQLGGCPSCGGTRFEALGAGVGRITEVLRRAYGPQSVGPVGSDTLVWVGTERDIPSLTDIGLAVVVDADGLILGSTYNAAEEALRVLARLAAAVRFGRGRRLIVQTGLPDHPVISALRAGDPVPFLRGELEARTELGLPPVGEVIVVQVAGETEGAANRLREAVGSEATLLGPVEREGRLRWLIQGHNLGAVRESLRPVVQKIRDRGGVVRLDVDPIDL